MPHRCLIAFALLVGFASNPLLATGFGEANAAEMATQTSSQGGVKITVESRGFPRDARTWDFAITLETHTQTLDDDLVHASALFADGKPYRPLGWDGSPPGGHHRKGVLRFEAVTPLPKAVELQIRRAGEASPRIFRWQPDQRP
jgi:hypothetical protein